MKYVYYNMKIKNLIIVGMFILTACDLEIADLTGNGAYIINTEVLVKSNTNFPISSALVKMEWKIDDYYISNRDSSYTNSDGTVTLQAYIENLYISNQPPQIYFYVSSSGFQNDTIIINANPFTSDMLDTLTNQYVQNINYTIYLVPE